MIQSEETVGQEVEFNPFVADPLFSFARRHGLGGGRALLLLAPVLALLVLIVNRIQGTLAHPGGSTVWELDFEKIILRRTYPTEAYGGYELSTDFPLFRDYPSLLLIALISGWLYVLYRQWVYMEAYLPTLLKSGCLRPTSEDEFTRIVDWGNKWLHRLGRHNLIQFIAALAFTLLIVFAHTQAGIFGILAPTDSPSEWTQDAYDNWWASWRFPLGFFTYFSVVILAMYYLIKQNAVGIIVVMGLYRLDRVAESHLDLVNADGHFGWSIFRKNMLTVFASMLVVGSSLLILLLVVSIEQLAWLSTFAVVFFVTSPVFLVIPPLLLRRRLARDKTARIDHVVEDLEHRRLGGRTTSEIPAEQTLHAATVISTLRSAPTLPFRGGGTIVAVAAYLVQLAIAIIAWRDIA